MVYAYLPNSKQTRMQIIVIKKNHLQKKLYGSVGTKHYNGENK